MCEHRLEKYGSCFYSNLLILMHCINRHMEQKKVREKKGEDTTDICWAEKYGYLATQIHQDRHETEPEIGSFSFPFISAGPPISPGLSPAIPWSQRVAGTHIHLNLLGGWVEGASRFPYLQPLLLSPFIRILVE